MPLFESILGLLFVAVLLLQISRRLGTPYPALLALAGVGVGALPWAPPMEIEPHLALALFVAPVLLDAAYDTAPRALRQQWLPLVSLVVVAVVLTALAVAWAGQLMVGLPWSAALALGAIVAPPDAAAASAVLGQFQLPRRTLTILQGESLLNDAVALLIFGGAVSATDSTGSPLAASLLTLGLAVPGGLALGWLAARLYVPLVPWIAGTLGASLLQFTTTYAVWVIAEHLRLSPILAVVAYGMTLALHVPARTSPRERVHAYSVWATVVFLLNVLAFLLMGMQVRGIISRLSGRDLGHDLAFAGVVLVLVIFVRLAWVMCYLSLIRWFRLPVQAPPDFRLGLLGSWCGMRGIVTLATALALPAGFPGRDLIVLSAFTVVLGTLVLQGMTLQWLISALHLEPDHSLEKELTLARTALLEAAIQTLRPRPEPQARAVCAEYEHARALTQTPDLPPGPTVHNGLRRTAIAAQRQVLETLRREDRIGDDTYHLLEEELDWNDLAASPAADRELRDT